MDQNEIEIKNETIIDKHTKYRENNKDKVQEKNKKYRDKNKEKQTASYTCTICDCQMQFREKTRHNKTLKHTNNKGKTTEDEEKIKEDEKNNKIKSTSPYTCIICNCQMQFKSKPRHDKSEKHANYINFIKTLNENNIDRKNIKEHYEQITIKHHVVLDEIRINDKWYICYRYGKNNAYVAYDENRKKIFCLEC